MAFESSYEVVRSSGITVNGVHFSNGAELRVVHYPNSKDLVIASGAGVVRVFGSTLKRLYELDWINGLFLHEPVVNVLFNARTGSAFQFLAIAPDFCEVFPATFDGVEYLNKWLTRTGLPHNFTTDARGLIKRVFAGEVF